MSRAFLLLPLPHPYLRHIVHTSLSVPHTYAIVGGGEWGPRVVAKALLESVYVDWVDDVYLLDMEEGKSYLRPDNGFDKVRAVFSHHTSVGWCEIKTS